MKILNSTNKNFNNSLNKYPAAKAPIANITSGIIIINGDS